MASVCRTIRRHMIVPKQRNRLECPVQYQRGHKKRSWLSRLLAIIKISYKLLVKWIEKRWFR